MSAQPTPARRSGVIMFSLSARGHMPVTFLPEISIAVLEQVVRSGWEAVPCDGEEGSKGIRAIQWADAGQRIRPCDWAKYWQISHLFSRNFEIVMRNMKAWEGPGYAWSQRSSFAQAAWHPSFDLATWDPDHWFDTGFLAKRIVDREGGAEQHVVEWNDLAKHMARVVPNGLRGHQVVEFRDLKSACAFFHRRSDKVKSDMRLIRMIRIKYWDEYDGNTTNWGAHAWDGLRVAVNSGWINPRRITLDIHVPRYSLVRGIDAKGLWAFMKLYGFDYCRWRGRYLPAGLAPFLRDRVCKRRRHDAMPEFNKTPNPGALSGLVARGLANPNPWIISRLQQATTQQQITEILVAWIWVLVDRYYRQRDNAYRRRKERAVQEAQVECPQDDEGFSF